MGSTSPSSIPAEWAEGLERRGHLVRVITAAKAGRGTWGFIPHLWQTAGSFRPHIIHFHHTRPALSSLAFPRRSPAARTVLTVHRMVSEMGLAGRIGHTIGGIFGVDAVVANSDATLASLPNSFRRLGVRCDRIYNGVDLKRLDSVAPPIPAAREEIVHLVSVGRLIAEKGYDTLLRAVAILQGDAGFPVELTIVGAGPLRRELESLTKRLSLTGAVNFTGSLERNEVYQRLWSADGFVLSSRTEGFCNAVVEAMAAGLPVVVTPGGALPEVVGAAGWVTKDHSAEAIVDGVVRVFQSGSNLRGRLADAASRRARELFSLDATLTSYEALYTQLLAAATPAGGSAAL